MLSAKLLPWFSDRNKHGIMNTYKWGLTVSATSEAELELSPSPKNACFTRLRCYASSNSHIGWCQQRPGGGPKFPTLLTRWWPSYPGAPPSPSTASVLRHRTRFAHNTLRFPVSLWALGSCSRLFTSSLSYMLIWHAMSTATYPFQTSLALPASGWHLLFITSVTWLSASSSWLQTPASRPVFSNTSTLDLPLSKLHTGLDTTYTG